MIAQVFAALTRGVTSAGTHESALARFGAAEPAATVTVSGLAAAGQRGGKAKKRCTKQRGQCLAFLTDFCDGNPNCQEEKAFPCCEHFAGCDIAAAAACILLAFD